MPRKFKDITLKAVVALPLAANVANTAVIDLGSAISHPLNEKFAVKITIDTATGANSKNVNASLQASNESNANLNAIPGVGTVLVAAGNAANVIGANVEVVLPPGFNKRYIRATFTGEANGGNAADGNGTLELLF